MLSFSSAGPYIRDIPMHPSASGNTAGPAAPSWRGSIVVSLSIDPLSYRSEGFVGSVLGAIWAPAPAPAAACWRGCFVFSGTIAPLFFGWEGWGEAVRAAFAPPAPGSAQSETA